VVLARVAGTVVATRKEPRLEGLTLLLLERLDPSTMAGKGEYLVAMDTVGAGPGEVVFYVAGSSARLTAVTDGKPSDAAIVAIVDTVELDGRAVYQKDQA
jgi:microcompartment protein CcmK/EutM